MNRPLKLRAEDKDDLQVISGCLQDAIVPIGEMCFLPEEKRFVMVANRFRWETITEGEAEAMPLGDASYDGDGDVIPPFERTNCGLCFDGVTAVKVRGLNLHDRHQMLELLAFEAAADGIVMHFSGGACIKLDGERWICHLQDIGEPWPTSHRPTHPLD